MTSKTSTRKATPPDHVGDGLRVRGFFRVNIVEQKDGKLEIVGDSGWCPNMITNIGRRDYLLNPLAGGAANPIARMGLGTGTSTAGVPAATDTSLLGELSHQANAASGTRNRAAIGAPVTVSSTQVQFAATFASSVSFVTTVVTIGNIMIINSATSGGTIFAGNTFPSSQLNINQDVQASYNILFSTA